MTGYIAVYRVENNAETIELPVFMHKHYGDNEASASVLGHLGQVHRVDALYAYHGQPVHLLTIKPAS